MLLFIALAILTAIQFSHVFLIAAAAGVVVALSMAVSHLVFRLLGAPTTR